MKRLITTLLICILSLGAMAQFNELSRKLKGGKTTNSTNSTNSGMNGTGFDRNGKRGDKNTRAMTAADSARLLIKPRMNLTRWMHNGVYKVVTKRDTTIDRAHIYNPYFNKSISNTYLSNIASAHISNIFIDRDTRTDYQFIKVYDAYLNRPEDHLDINTTTPFTLVEYKTGGGSNTGEDFLKVIHTQNVTPYWNVGINYNYLRGKGHYMHSKGTVYDVAGYASYEKDRIAFNIFINNNIGNFEENGGIEDPTSIRDTTISPENIPVKLLFPETHFYNINFRTSAQYNIGKPKDIILTNDTIKYYPLKVVYSFQQEDNERTFTESSLTKDYFTSNYLSDEKTSDKNGYRHNQQSARIVWNEEMKSLKPGMYAGLSSSQKRYTFSRDFSDALESFNNSNLPTSSLITQAIDEIKFYNTYYLEGGIFKQDSGKLNFDINAKLAIKGDYRDEKFLNANIAFNINTNNTFAFQGKYSEKAASHNLNYYFSNHYKWDNHFKDQKDIKLSAKYINRKLNLEIGGVMNTTNKYIYFGLKGVPQQHEKEIKIYTAYFQHRLDLWKFHFVNKLYYQSSDSEIIDLPEISYFGSYYFKNYVFNNALLLELGANLTYNTKFYSPSYNIATNSFYRQDQEKFGAYPKIDLFANFKIKRMTIFIKYEHLNQSFGNKNYFLNSYYAMDPGTLKYGFRWIFND